MFIVNDIYFLFAQVEKVLFGQVCVPVFGLRRFDKFDVQELFGDELLQLVLESGA